jgi:hypothetical protein
MAGVTQSCFIVPAPFLCQPGGLVLLLSYFFCQIDFRARLVKGQTLMTVTDSGFAAESDSMYIGYEQVFDTQPVFYY